MKFLLKHNIIAVLVLIFAGAVIVYAANSYRSDPITTVMVNEWSTCKNVKNDGSLSHSYFIPTKTSAEWSAFRNADSYLTDISLSECYTYSWWASGFGACSPSCGPGTQTQTVQCKRNQDGTVVADSYCPAGSKPATDQSCNNGACATCSDGTQNQGETGVDCGGPCAACAPTYTYSWQQSGFGACSVSCGGGTQTQTVQCKRSPGGDIMTGPNEALCTGAKPATSQSCNNGACPSVYLPDTGEIQGQSKWRWSGNGNTITLEVWQGTPAYWQLIATMQLTGFTASGSVVIPTSPNQGEYYILGTDNGLHFDWYNNGNYSGDITFNGASASGNIHFTFDIADWGTGLQASGNIITFTLYGWHTPIIIGNITITTPV